MGQCSEVGCARETMDGRRICGVHEEQRARGFRVVWTGRMPLMGLLEEFLRQPFGDYEMPRRRARAKVNLQSWYGS